MAYQRISVPVDAIAMLLEAASTFARPSIPVHYPLTDADERLNRTVPDWDHVRKRRTNVIRGLGVVSSDPKVPVCEPKRQGKGRTFTSRYRGVHQTFPTMRWEAQFRRNGKPTSLGCFDEEEDAARAYDKMKVWCWMHDPKTLEGGLKAGTINFDVSEYERDIGHLDEMSQDDLIGSLRSYGREQAAERLSKLKKDQRAQCPI